MGSELEAFAVANLHGICEKGGLLCFVLLPSGGRFKVLRYMDYALWVKGLCKQKNFCWVERGGALSPVSFFTI